jgi:hypothetical protein
MSKLQKKTNKKEAYYKWGPKSERTSSVSSKRKKRQEDLVLSPDWLKRQKQIVKGWMHWMQDRWDEGYDLYLFTFMFNELSGNERAKLAQMESELYGFYGRLATRIAKKPASHAGHRLLPRMVLHPDTNFYKSQPIPLGHAKTNDGLHFHGACAADRRGKVKRFLDDYFEECQSEFVTPKLRTVHVRRVTHMPDFVTDYALKAMKRGLFDGDRMIIFPKSLREIKNKKQK